MVEITQFASKQCFDFALMRFWRLSTVKRSKTEMFIDENELFENAFESGDFWKRRSSAFGVDGRNGTFRKRWRHNIIMQSPVVLRGDALEACAQDSKNVRKKPGNEITSLDIRFSFPSVYRHLFICFKAFKNSTEPPHNVCDRPCFQNLLLSLCL